MLSRRRFLLSTLGTVGLMAAGCQPSPAPTPTAAPKTEAKPTEAPKPAASPAAAASPAVGASPAASPAPGASPAASPSPAAKPASSAPSKPTQIVDVTTQLGWLRNGEFAPILVAEAKGYFTEEGIRHRILDGGPGKNPVPIVGAGQAQFGITAGGNAVFQARLAPDPVDVMAVGTLLQSGPYSYIRLANPGDPAPQPKDLESKTVGMQSDGDIFLKAFAKKHNLDLSKIKIEVVQANAEPLLVGKVDWFTGWITNQTYQIEQEAAKPDAPPNLKGKTWQALRFAEWGIRSYSDVIFTTGATIKGNLELVQRYVRAVARGMQFILDNPADSVQLVANFPEQVEKADKLEWRWKIQNPLFVSEDTRANGLLWMNPMVWEEMMAFYKEYDQIPRVIPTAEMMTNDFIPGPGLRA